MRLVPTRSITPEKPVTVKKERAKLTHFSAPVGGLAEQARSTVTDPKFAGILVNMYPDDDRITTRAGFQKVATVAGGFPVEHLIPYYGQPQRLLAACNNTLADATTGTVLKSGFTTNNWHWTMFSNLGDTEYVVMCNGNDGVFSWDGLTNAASAALNISKIAKATSPAKDAVVTLQTTSDISKFNNGDIVTITGADAGHSAANGGQMVYNINAAAGTFSLANVDTTTWSADQTTGTMKVVNQGSFATEPVKPPAGNTWLQVTDLAIVCSHMNRLFFADEANLAVYYLPLQQKNGTLSVLPLNAIFRRGGTVRALATWTVDGGRGLDDQLCIFSSNGELAIYSGVDPDSDFSLVGCFDFEAPMSKWSVQKYGGELYALIPTGLTAMSTSIKSGREGVEAADKSVITLFRSNAIAYHDNPGWEIFLNPNSGRMFCNVPVGGNVYRQYVRGMAKPAWSEFRNIPARCWGWIEPYVYHADDFGNIYRMHPSIQSDDGQPIFIDVQMAWSQYKTPAVKHFKMILPYILTDGYPNPAIDLKVDYDSSDPVNKPDITQPDAGLATWDTAKWADAPDAGPNDTFWVSSVTRNWTNWTGVGAMGRVGAVRLQARIQNCSFSITGFDVLYDSGSVFG